MEFKSGIVSNKIRIVSSRISASRITWIFSFALLTAISAQLTIPMKPVPITLQTMAVVLAGAFIGAKDGAYSQVLYLFLGIIGLPVFAQTPDAPVGIARLFGPTGGYLLAFPLAAYLTGFIVERNKNYINVVIALFAGDLLIILVGTIILDLFFIRNFELSLKAGAAVFSIWTVIKVFTAASIFFTINKSSAKS
ncbi:MAG TPA: biotin transporter BioY [Ignavibacteriaceae bacterium]|nr:biotin transporter BioY [Ignavibacteriaceae bacterium]